MTALAGAERALNGLAVLAGILTLGFIAWGFWQGLTRPQGRTTGRAATMLRAPVMLLLTILWFGACIILWRPLPVTLTSAATALSLTAGTLLYFPGLALYVWGAVTLGKMFSPSSAFGDRLHAEHRLVTHGPFAYLRHPLYLGLILASLGGLFLFRTWTFVFVPLNFMFLPLRARREEKALAEEFGEAWQSYAARVPAFFPKRPDKADISG